MPIADGGLGLHDSVDSSHGAYIASILDVKLREKYNSFPELPMFSEVNISLLYIGNKLENTSNPSLAEIALWRDGILIGEDDNFSVHMTRSIQEVIGKI